MNGSEVPALGHFIVFIVMLFSVGLYCIVLTRNLIKALIGIEIMAKAVTLLFIVLGRVTHHEALAQAMVVTMIIIEVVVIVIAGGVVLGVYRHEESLDVRSLRKLRG